MTACGASVVAVGSGGNCSPKGGSSGTATQVVKVVSDSNTVGAYTPKTITIQSGQSVEWDWRDSGVPHSVTADDSSFDSCL